MLIDHFEHPPVASVVRLGFPVRQGPESSPYLTMNGPCRGCPPTSGT